MATATVVCDGQCVLGHEAGEYELHEITVPKKFWEDHQNRELVGCEATGRLGAFYRFVTPIKETKQKVTLMLTSDAIDELASDADYYADPAFIRDMVADHGISAYGLARSAAATLQAIKDWKAAR